MKEQILKYFFLLLLCIFSFSSIIYSQWTQQKSGLQFWHKGNAIDACDSNTAIIAVDSTLFETEDAGNTWEKVTYPSVGNGAVADVSILDKEHFWIATWNGEILATSNGGINWSVQFYDTTKTRFMDYVKMFDLNNGVAIGDAVGNNPFLFLTTSDGGKNWVAANYNNFQAGFSEDLWRPISFINPSIGYFNMYRLEVNSLLLKTTDGGKSWIDIHHINSAELIKFYNENLGLSVSLSGIGFLFSRTTDGGNSWESLYLTSKDDPAYPSDVEFVPGHPSELWFADLPNLYFSSDTGRTWTEQKISNENLNGREIVFTDSNHGWLLCDSGKVFYTSNNGGIITEVSPIENITPSEYLLKQNYPNPFNPSTTIKYQIPKSEHVTLKIYDILGRVVAILVDEYQKAGIYSIEYGVKSKELASGIYFYRLRAGNYVSTKKMLLLK